MLAMESILKWLGISRMNYFKLEIDAEKKA